jgi:hypothetical protein
LWFKLNQEDETEDQDEDEVEDTDDETDDEIADQIHHLDQDSKGDQKDKNKKISRIKF